jgi:hypothetical protein
VGKEVVITSNDANTLTITNPGFVPDTTTKYIIMDTFVATAGTSTTLTDTHKSNKWAGKRLFILLVLVKEQTTITSNTVNTLTYLSIVPDTTTCYTILGVSTRSVGVGLRWIFGNTDADLKGTFNMSKRW